MFVCVLGSSAIVRKEVAHSVLRNTGEGTSQSSTQPTTTTTTTTTTTIGQPTFAMGGRPLLGVVEENGVYIHGNLRIS